MIDPQSVQEHYTLGDLTVRILQALDSAGLGQSQLDWQDLAPIDQFHVGGISATKELAQSLSFQPGSTVLDIGCGLGGPARYLAAVHGSQVTGIDLSRPFIDAAQKLGRRTGLNDRLTFVQGDALDLPFPDAGFDNAWTQHVAMNIADRARFYSEIRRVLKPGGKLAIYDVLAGDGRPLAYPVPWAARPDLSHLLTLEAMHDVLGRTGFTIHSWEDTTDKGISWFSEQLAARRVSMTPKSLSLAVVMGPDFASMAANLVQNLKDGRARLVQAVAERSTDSFRSDEQVTGGRE